MKFPDHEAFDRYTSDDKLRTLAPLTEKAISPCAAFMSATKVEYAEQG